MYKFLLTPPITFLMLLAIFFLFSFILKRVSAKGKDSQLKTTAYACGENMVENTGQPEYSQFFKFAFFFTIMHVVVLTVATDPMGISVTSGLYLVITVLSLFMLFRRR